SHSGLNLAKVFTQILEDFDISDKILSVTCDNASANDAMIHKLEMLLPDFPGETNHTRCFAHIVNLVTKSLLKQFDAKSKHGAPDSEAELMPELEEIEDELEEEEAQARIEDAIESGEVDPKNGEGLVDEVAEISADEQKELAKNMRLVRLVLGKLRKITFKTLHSTTILLPAWKSTLKDLGIKEHIIPCDISTRWNSTYDMLHFVLEHKRAVRAFVGDTKLGLDAFELTAQEWSIAQQLHDVLHYTHILIVSSQILKDATSFFSHGTPNLVTVIPAMDHIDQHLTFDSLDTKFHPVIRASLNIAKCTLNRYYTMTDLSEVYRIAMVLHPRHKLAYFKNARWEQEWIDTARDVVHDKFKHSYASREVERDEEGHSEAAQEENEVTNSNIFDNLPALSAPTTDDDRDELERYLSTDPEPIGDALAWMIGSNGSLC
ncbi:hypothetical protein EWM64_g10871, partial [Hericium alpestre]